MIRTHETLPNPCPGLKEPVGDSKIRNDDRWVDHEKEQGMQILISFKPFQPI